MNYRWDFPLKNKNMDKPTSEKDVIKSLPGSSPTERMLLKVKPVFDKMLAALKVQDGLIGEAHQYSERDRGVAKDEQKRILWLNAWLLFSNSVQDLKQAIKEAEELGL